ncbi:hypothetical protein QF028_001514 [Neobacillus sp. B4I6]|uniref:hypothetical protein n=1 Tax=Neobacillus sp. B4I6 TaxID=3373925 RepID=UPI003D1EFFAF
MSRPLAYETTTLMGCIEAYKAKYKNQFTTLSPSKIAKYMTVEMKMPANYQHFTRNADIKAYLEDYNKEALNRAKKQVHRHAVDSDMPFYTPLNVKQFMKKNNTPKKLEEALITLDSIREKDHESYQKIVGKLVEVGEKYAILNQENIELKRKKETIKDSFEEQLKIVKKELIKTKKKSLQHSARAQVYEQFMRKHHFQKIEEMALYLENIIVSDIEFDNTAAMMDIESYKKNKYDMLGVLKAYNSIITTINADDDHETIFEETDVVYENDGNENEQGLWNGILDAIDVVKQNEIPEIEDSNAKGKKLRDRMRSLPSKILED